MRPLAHHAYLPALLLALIAVATPWLGLAYAQVSPGPLSTAHAALDSPLQCLQCHGKGGAMADMDARCLACHKEVAWMRTAQRGFHARVSAKNCASCHPDHGGRDFELVIWDEGAAAKFDHRRAGFVLEGKHASLACAACHKPALQKSPATALIQKKHHATSWLGLQTACADCHTDVHRGQLGVKCQTCHTHTKWKPAPGFDHAHSDYPLTGAHVQFDCMKCHAAAQFVKATDAKGLPVPQWKPIPHADCTPCHRDPHAGRFKGACEACHVTTDFHTISRTGFDHNQTRYPLKGKHAQVACANCHDPAHGGFGAKPKFAQCADCHADAHNGTATLAGKVADCATCHGVSGFSGPSYTAAMHQQSAYPLEGAHATADCSGCHRKLPASDASAAALGSARVMLRPKFGACVDCHGDPHAGRFSAPNPRARKAECVACHNMSAYSPSKFDGRMHAECAFPLEGAHMSVPCQACHAELKSPRSKTSLRGGELRALSFESKQRLCADCHQSPHGTQFAGRKDHGACTSCHGVEAFVPTDRFNHDRDSQFKLDGAHKTTPCASCHESRPDKSGHAFASYVPTPTRCEACHR